MRRLILLPLLILGYSMFQSDDGQAAIIRKPGVGGAAGLRNMIQGKGGAAAAAANVDYELTTAEGVKVRIKELQMEFDEKGRVKKYTPEELKKRKGDTPEEQKLSGYKIDYNVLKPGDVIQVSLSRVNKDKESKSWSSAGNMVGTVIDVSANVITLRVNPNGPPPAANQQGGRPGGGEGKPGAGNAERGGGGKGGGPQGQAANKVVISADKSQATTIMILEQAPEPEGKRGKDREKKKDK